MSDKAPPKVTLAQAKRAFQDQLTEVERLGLPTRIIKTADDLIKPNKAWDEEVTVSMYLGIFLEQHPHLRGARNLPVIRKAIRTDLESKGIL